MKTAAKKVSRKNTKKRRRSLSASLHRIMRSLKRGGIKYVIIGVTALLLLLVLIFGIRGCGVSHKTPEKVVKALIRSYADGKRNRIKDCYGKKKDASEELQTEIDSTIRYFEAHRPQKVTVDDCGIISQNGKYSYVYIVYGIQLEDGQVYPCIGTYMTMNEDDKYYVLPPSEITEDMSKEAAAAYADFMNTDAYKQYVTAYDTFIKKNPGYEDRIIERLR